MKHKVTLALLAIGILSISALAQSNQKSKDTSKKEWPYAMPILGKKAVERGYNIQLPHGVMSNTYFNTQEILINDLQVSLGDNPLVSLDDIVSFGEVKASVVTTNLRFDTWVLPFWNVYGFAGVVDVRTDIKVTSPIEFTTTSENPGQYYGFGTMLAGKLGPIFITGDINFAWTNLKLLKEPTLASIVGIRIGHRFALSNNPESNIAIWGGAMYQALGSVTKGAIDTEIALDLSDEEVKDLEEWYDGLEEGPVKELAGDLIEELTTPTQTKINYSIKKELKHAWNPVIGAQWQINNHWQLRAEFGFITKQQTLFSLNYRFGIRG